MQNNGIRILALLGILLILPSSVLAWTYDPVAFYELEETGVIYVDSQTGTHDFVIAADPPTRAAGTLNFGQQFDGTSEYLELATGEAINLCSNEHFVASLWVFVDSTSNDRERIVSWSGGGGTEHYLAWWALGSNNNYFYVGYLDDTGTLKEANTHSVFPVGEWVLVTTEWYRGVGGPVFKIWQNGVLKSTTGTGGGVHPTNDCSTHCTGSGCQLNFGRMDGYITPGVWEYDFAGRLDEVGFWNNPGGAVDVSVGSVIHQEMLNSGPGKLFANLDADSTQNTALLTDVRAHYNMDDVSVPLLDSVASHSLAQSVASQRPSQTTGLIAFGQDFEMTTFDEVYATDAIWDATSDGWSHQIWAKLQTLPAAGGTCGGAWGGVSPVTNYPCPKNTEKWETEVHNTIGPSLQLPGGDAQIGAWTHLLTTYQGTGTGLTYFYVDGQIMNSGIMTTTTTVPSSIYYLGKNGGSVGTYPLDGVLDEVALWQGRALNVEEVIALYNSGAGKAYPTWGGSPPAPGSSSNVSLNVGCPANVVCSLTYDPLTSIFNYTIDDSELTITNITLDVTYINGSSLGYATFSTNSTANYTGSVLIDASSIAVHNWTMRGFGYITDYNRTFISGSPTILTNHIWIYGSSTLDPSNFNIGGNPEGLFWAAAMIASLMLFGAWNPPVSVMLGAIGVVLATWFGLLNISTTTLWTVVIAALVVAWGLVS